MTAVVVPLLPVMSRPAAVLEEVSGDEAAERAAGGEAGDVVELEVDAADHAALARLVRRLREAPEAPRDAGHVVRADREAHVAPENRREDRVGGAAEGAVAGGVAREV